MVGQEINECSAKLFVCARNERMNEANEKSFLGDWEMNEMKSYVFDCLYKKWRNEWSKWKIVCLGKILMKNQLSGQKWNKQKLIFWVMKELKIQKNEKNQLPQKSLNVKNKNVNKTKENILRTILINKNQNYVIFLAEIFWII